MNFNEYQKLASRTINENLGKNEVTLHALFGMCGELGEIQSLYQKIYQGHIFDKEHLFSEIGDLLWFISELATIYDFTLEDIAIHNIEKLKKRYPKGFESNRSLNREKGDV